MNDDKNGIGIVMEERDPQINLGIERVKYTRRNIELEVLVSPSEGTVWLSLNDMATLYERERSVIGKYVRNVLANNHENSSTWAKFARVGANGKNYDMVHYNLDIVLSVGNRIRSENTQPFQQWCKRILADRRQPFDDTKPNIIRFKEGNVSLDVRIDPEEDTVYLTQSQIAFLFDTTIPNVSMHIRNIVAEGELTLGQTVKDFLIVQTEGKSRVTTRAVDHYNLDMILSIGYRVKSKAAISFRRWANSVLKEYLLRGYAIDERRALVTPENYLGLVHRVDSLDERVSKLEKDENYYFKDRVIYEGQVFEALTLIDSLVRKAVSSIVLIDPYCDIRALDCLKGKDKTVGLRVITSTKTTLSPKRMPLRRSSSSIPLPSKSCCPILAK